MTSVHVFVRICDLSLITVGAAFATLLRFLPGIMELPDYHPGPPSILFICGITRFKG